MSEFISIYITVADRDTALKVAQTLVSEDLVACFNLVENVTSVYKWKGELEKVSEVILIGKSKSKLKDKITARAKALSGYEVPCIVFTEILDGEATYLDWVKTNTL